MWINEALDKVNQDLYSMEKHKEALASAVRNQRPPEILNPYGYTSLHDSKIWSKTENEVKAFEDFTIKVQGYNPYNNIQRKVIRFGETTNQKYRSFTMDEDRKELETYIDASRYWNKKTVTVKASDEKQLKVVYASNSDMQCIIFQYLGYMVISTMSSFDNYLRDIEGKGTKIPQINKIRTKYRTGVAHKPKLYEALEPREGNVFDIANKLEGEIYG